MRGHERHTNLPALKKRKPQFKGVRSQILQNALVRLDLAFDNLLHRMREGVKTLGYPRVKGRERCEVSLIRRLLLFAFLRVGSRYVL